MNNRSQRFIPARVSATAIKARWILLNLLAGAVVLLTGCAPQGDTPAEMKVSPSSLSFTENRQESILVIENSGDEDLEWNLANKDAEWAQLSFIQGQIPGGETMEISVFSDASIGAGQFSSSFELSSNGGDIVVQLSMEINGVVPPNTSYNGLTQEGLPFAFSIDYNNLVDLQAERMSGEDVLEESVPLFGLITYSGDTLVCDSDNGSSIRGVFDPEDEIISGEWVLDEVSRSFSVTINSNGTE